MDQTLRRAALAAAASLALAPSAFADTAASGRQSLDDAWWTGPLLASGASTQPKGHIMFVP